MNYFNRDSVLAYGVAIACLVAAVLLRWMMDPILGDTLPLVTLFGAAGAAVWIGGYRPAFFVAALGYLACNYLFIAPRGQLNLSHAQELVGLFLYLVSALIIIGFGEALRRARQQSRLGEASARQQAELLRITLTSIGDGVIATDAEGCVTSMNAVAEALTGWKNGEVAGLPLTQLFRILNESTRLEVENPVLQALKDGVIVGLANHTLLIAKDGTERPIEDSAAPIRQADGEIVGCVLVFRDISERYRAEAEQREAQQQIATTLESVTDGFMRYDRDWRIVYVNLEAERINRLPRSELLGRTLWEVFPVLIGTHFEAEFRRALAEQTTVEFENHYEPFGRWYSIKGYPTADGGLTTFIRDITEQKCHQEALQRSEARLRRVFESNVVGMIRWDLDRSLILDANDTFLQMTGYTREDVAAGRLNFRDMTPAEWTSRNEEGIRTIQAKGFAAPYEKEYFRKDGSRLPLIIAGTCFDDSPSEGMSILIDLSASKRAEQEVARLAAESERQRRLYETVLTNTPDFVYVFSLDHKVLYANDALIKMWGRGYEGAIGKTFLEIGYEPWHAQMHDREIDQVRATRQPIRGEVPFDGTNGRRQYDYIFVPVIGADGEVEAVAGTTRDVTERKQTEDQLRRNHDTFFALIENNPFGVYAIDADFRLRHVSLGAQKVFETVSPLLGRDFAEVLRIIWPEPFVSEVIGRFRHTLDTGEAYSAPSTLERRADIGEVQAYDWRIERISLPDGRYGVVCYFYDLSERQRWEAALRGSEERLRLATEAAQLGIWTWQPQRDQVVWENARPYEIFALSPTEPPISAARFKAEFLCPQDIETFEIAFGRTIQTKLPLLCELPIRRTDGETRWVEFTGRVVEGEEDLRLIGTVQDITERKMAEEAIRVSEARHSFMVALADTLRPLSDPAEVKAEASRVLGERLGANRVVYFEICGDEYIIEQDYTAGVRPLAGGYPVAAFGPDLLAALLEGRTVIEADATIEPDHSPGEQAAFASIQVRGHVDVPLIKGGQFVAGMTVHVCERREWTRQDVALIEETAERTWAAVERVRAEAALHESDARYRAVVEGQSELVCRFRVDGKIIFANSAYARSVGTSTEALEGSDFWSLIPAADRRAVKAMLDGLTSDAPECRIENRFVTQAGERWMLWTNRGLKFDSDGRVLEVQSAGIDITDRKNAETALRQSEEGRRLALDAAELGAFNIDTTTNTLTTDERFRIIFVGTAEAMSYEQAFTAIHTDDRERIRAAVAAATHPDNPAPYAEEYRVVHPDGSVRWVFARGRAKFDQGEPRQVVSFDGTIADVTSRKSIEEERERLVGQLRDADRRKDEFLATLAHELRNPLAPIRNGLQVMRLAGASGTMEETRSMMERQLMQLVHLVDDLLDVSRATSGKLTLRRERVELQAVIDAAIETTRPVIEQAGHVLAVTLPNEPIFVDGDATRLSQVVSNLLNNSAKYTYRGGHIRLAVHREEDIAVVVVTDDGIGIPTNMLGKVFDMFAQVDRALEKTTGGLGIGLSLVKGIVELHGGTIEAHSEGEGRGSAFVVRLPLALSAGHKVEPSVGELPVSSSSRRRILIADDNVDSATTLGQLLELLGNDVSITHDGLQAVEEAERFRPDVILLDIGMPKLNGYDACGRIRQQPWGREALLVALTGWGQDDDKRRSKEAGFDVHLVKPVDLGALKKLLQ
ncbi:MAG TPA: PAS domain S-box protein [Cellvibrionaceae bacterium]